MSTVNANNSPSTVNVRQDQSDLELIPAHCTDAPESLSLRSTTGQELGVEQLRPVFASAGEQVVSITKTNQGLTSSTYAVTCSNADYVLKTYPKDRHVAEIDFEMSVLEFLAENNIPAQEPVNVLSDDLIIDEHPAAVFVPLPGQPCTRSQLNPTLVYNTGAYLAGVQDVLRSFTPAGTRPRFDVEYVFPFVLDQINRRVGAESGPAAERLNRMLAKACENFIADDLPIGVVHGDIYPGNLHVQGDTVVGLTSFDDAYVGTMLFDLATAAMEFSFDGVVTLDEKLLGSFIAGYESPGQRIDLDLLVEAMWFSCFRFFGYTLAATSEGAAANQTTAGHNWRLSTHYRRLELLSHQTYRDEVADRVRKIITHIETTGVLPT